MYIYIYIFISNAKINTAISSIMPVRSPNPNPIRSQENSKEKKRNKTTIINNNNNNNNNKQNR